MLNLNLIERSMISLHYSILGHFNKGFMAKKHQILFLALVLSCDIFLDSEAASALNISLRVDVNDKTILDESYTEGKFFAYVLVILYRGNKHLTDCKRFFYIGTTFLAINSSYFVGYCRHGSNEYNLIKWEIHYTEAKCRSECSAIDNCVAFAYKDKNHLIGDNCYLYGNGPYT